MALSKLGPRPGRYVSMLPPGFKDLLLQERIQQHTHRLETASLLRSLALEVGGFPEGSRLPEGYECFVPPIFISSIATPCIQEALEIKVIAIHCWSSTPFTRAGFSIIGE